MIKCDNCGSEVADYSLKNCPFCGDSLKAAEETINIKNPFLNSTRKEEAEEISVSKDPLVEEEKAAVVEDPVVEEDSKEEKSSQKKKKKKKKVKYDKKNIKKTKSTIKDKPKTVKYTSAKISGVKLPAKAYESFKLNPALRRKLSKKERKSILFSTVIAVLLLIITLLYLLYYSIFGNFETPIREYYTALNIASEEQILYVYPPCIRKNEEFKSMINQYMQPMKHHPDARFRYELISNKDLSFEDLDAHQIDYDLTCGKGEMKIEAAQIVRVKHILNQGSKVEEYEEEINIVVGKIDKKWYILE